MIDPVEIDLSSYIGSDYYDDWNFWSDAAQKAPYNFSNWTQFTLVIGSLRLTEGAGLTINRTGGTVSPAIDRATTATQRPGTASYALSAIDENGKLGFLMLGRFEWKQGNPS